MGLKRFSDLFPDLGDSETRIAKISDPENSTDPNDPEELKTDDYAFDEFYCTEPGCDCRRVVFFVYARHAKRQVATISHSFDRPKRNSLVRKQTFLDPILPQSKMAPAVLELFKDVVLADADYRNRLERHYRMVKADVRAGHPGSHGAGESAFGLDKRSPDRPRVQDLLPPKRRGKRKWR